MISPTPLLDQITPYLRTKFSRLPEKIQKIISQLGWGETYVKSGFKVSKEPTDEFPNLIKVSPLHEELFYQWDRFSAFDRELKVTEIDYENNPISLTELIKPHLKKKFDRLPKKIKIYVAIAGLRHEWDTLAIKGREELVFLFDCKHDPVGAQIIDDSFKLYQEKQGVQWQIDELDLLPANTPLELESRKRQLEELYHRRDVEIPKRQAALSGTKIKPESSDSETNQKIETPLASIPTPDSAKPKPENGKTKPWEIVDPRDPEPIQPWYTPARYFARKLVEEDSTLLVKRDQLAQKVTQSLTSAGIKKRGNVKPFDYGTVKKAFSKVNLG